MGIKSFILSWTLLVHLTTWICGAGTTNVNIFSRRGVTHRKDNKNNTKQNPDDLLSLAFWTQNQGRPGCRLESEHERAELAPVADRMDPMHPGVWGVLRLFAGAYPPVAPGDPPVPCQVVPLLARTRGQEWWISNIWKCLTAFTYQINANWMETPISKNKKQLTTQFVLIHNCLRKQLTNSAGAAF